MVRRAPSLGSRSWLATLIALVSGYRPPRVPSTEEVRELIGIALEAIPERQLWINPDCGLKTRGYAETVASLENILAATREARATLGA